MILKISVPPGHIDKVTAWCDDGKIKFDWGYYRIDNGNYVYRFSIPNEKSALLFCLKWASYILKEKKHANTEEAS